jgi:hypothetical protein
MGEYWRRGREQIVTLVQADHKKHVEEEYHREAETRRGTHSRLMFILLIGGVAIAVAYLINRMYCGTKDVSHKWEQRYTVVDDEP